MHARWAFTLAILSASTSEAAHAAPEEATGYGLPAPAPAPTPAPAPAPAPNQATGYGLQATGAEPAPAPLSNQTACVIGPELTVSGDQSGATAGVVCDALRRHGATVGPVVYAAAGFRAAYVVRLRPPGSSWSIAVTYEEPVGNPVKTRWMAISNFNEIPDAADTLAQSLVSDDSDPNAEVQRSADFGGTVDGWIGGGSSSLVDGNAEGGLAIGATGLIQYKWFGFGVGLTGTTAVFGESASLISGLAGLGTIPYRGFASICSAKAERSR